MEFGDLSFQPMICRRFLERQLERWKNTGVEVTFTKMATGGSAPNFLGYAYRILWSKVPGLGGDGTTVPWTTGYHEA